MVNLKSQEKSQSVIGCDYNEEVNMLIGWREKLQAMRSNQKLKDKKNVANTALELKRTVSDIKSGVHNQLEHTIKTQRRMQGIAKRINKMHTSSKGSR